MAYLGYEPSKVAVTVGQGVIDATHIQDASITTADLGNDSVTAIKIDDDGTGFQMGSLGLGTAVSGSHKLTVGGTATFSGDITGTLATASQGNITSVGTLTGLASSGTIVLGDLDIIPTSSNVSVIKHDSGSGSLTLQGDQVNIKNRAGDASGLQYNDGGGVTFPNNVIIGGENATPEVELFYNHSNGSDYKSYLKLAGNDLEVRGSSGTMEFYTGAVDGDSSTLALSIDSSQNTTFAGDVIVPQKIVHSGDTDTYLSFGTDSLSLYTGGTNVVDFIYGNIYIKGNNKALTGYTTGGGAKELIKINASDNLQIGEAGGGDVKITERLTVGSWDNSNTHGHAYIDISSDANEGADSCLYFNAGTAIKGSIYYNHNATASSQQMYFVTGDNSTNSLILDNSSATFAGDITLSANTSILHLGSRFRMKSDHDNATGYFGVGSSLNNFKFGNADFTGTAIAEINLSANVTALQVIKDTGAYTGYFYNDNGAAQGLHIKIKGNDSGQTGRYLIKGEGYGSTGAYSNNFLVDTDGNTTIAGNIDGGYGKSHRFTGNWKVLDVVSEDSNDQSTMSSNNPFSDQTYSHFKIIIPWIGVETDGADILCSFLYNTGSGLNEATGQYYGHKQTAAHGSSSYQGGAYSNADRMTIFNNTWNDDSGGINGEVLVYNVTTADMRNFSGTTYTAHDHTGDGDRGSNFRPFATFNIIGYDTTNGYGAQSGSFRQNDDRHAAYWKGIRFSTSTGNFATGSKFIVMGMQL